MPKYLLAYHGGGMPEDPADIPAEMAKWGAWMGANEAAFVDHGNPVGAARTIAADGSVNDGGGISGYSLIEADDLDAAVAIASGCPILGSGGSVEVGETFEPDMG